MAWIFYAASAVVIAWWIWGEVRTRFPKREKAPLPRWCEYGPLGETNINYNRDAEATGPR